MRYCKQLKVRCFIIILLLLPINLFSQVGFKAGMNLSDYYGSWENENGSKHSIYTGPVFGFTDDFMLNKDSLRNNSYSIGFELNFTQKGSLIRNYHNSVVFLELPIILKYIDSLGKFSDLKFQAGTIAEWYNSKSGYIPFQSMLIDYCGMLGAQLLYKGFVLDLRYTRGFTKIYSSYYIHVLTFSVGYAFLPHAISLIFNPVL